MGYRGEDLDLRTPQTWTAAPVDLSGGLGGEAGRVRSGVSRSGPIWVDETVLACCNHAFDLALLNRASEVRLEHLLHALTRIEAATEILEARGIRTGTLRRETATVISSDIPVGLTNGKSTPRRSELVEEVLRLAAANASRRNAPASVDDLVQILMDSDPNVPGVSLLVRNSTRLSLPQEPLVTRTPYQPEPRPADYADQGRLRLSASPGYYYGDYARSPRADMQATPIDNIQNSRIDSLEHMVRALSADLSNERKVFAGILQDLQRDVGTQRDDTSRLSGGILDRLQTFDAGFDRRIAEMTMSWSALSQRLQGLETTLSSSKTGIAQIDMQPVNERIGALERAVQASLLENQRAATTLSDKIKALETAVQSRPAVTSDGTIDVAGIIGRLDMIEEGVLAREITTREISDQLTRLRENLTADREKMMSAQSELSTSVGLITSRIDSDSGEAVSAILEPLNTRLQGLAGVIDGANTVTKESIASLSSAVEVVSQRLTATERTAAEQAVRFSEWQKTYTQELNEVHEAIMKLNSNQHTLAGSIDTWRQEGASMVTALGTRLAETVEREVAKPMALIEPINTSLARIDHMLSEREHKRGRLWYWLFGTRDWIAASWPSQAQRSTDDWKSLRAIWKR
jgi:hypothetical protein